MSNTSSNTTRLSLLLGGLLTMISGCEIQHEMVESDIKAKLKEKGVEITSIKCPKGVKLKEGATFECEGESDRGDKFVVEVKQTDAQGSISWELRGRIVDIKEIERDMQAKAGITDAKCSGNSFVAVKGTKFKCKSGGEEATFEFTNDKGDFDLVKP